jgi:hypothetical protein
VILLVIGLTAVVLYAVTGLSDTGERSPGRR